MSVTLRQLAVFVAVVDQRGFGAAADELAMSQSAVSHTLAAFERAAGCPLVTRGSPIATTALGAMILPHARATLASARAIESTIGTHRTQKVEGIVRIAAAPTTTHRLVPRLLAQWRSALPEVEVKLFEGSDTELVEWLDTGAVDCAVLIDPEPTAQGAVELTRDHFQAVVRADHPLSASSSIGLRELLEDPLLVSSSGCEPQIRQLHAMNGINFSPAQRIHGISTLLGMVEAGLGVAIMPRLAATMLPENLVMVDLDSRLERRLVFSGPSNRPWHPHVEKMRDVAALPQVE
jgi:DNA-binding transcriptional LysR family regulator